MARVFGDSGAQNNATGAKTPAEARPNEDALENPGRTWDKASSNVQPRLREGTELSGVAGSIRQTGDRFVFFSAKDNLRLTVLENLALERLLRLQEQSAAVAIWQVWGTVTEFRGQNYLLIKRCQLSGVESPKHS